MAIVQKQERIVVDPSTPISAKDIQLAIKTLCLDKYSKVFVPEFTFKNWRADAIIVDIQRQLVEGFEIKVRRTDWLRDKKYHHYTRFCSSVFIVAEKSVVKRSEVKEPFGLIRPSRNERGEVVLEIKKKPSQMSNSESLAWTWIYLEVLELEIRRLADENEKLTLIKGLQHGNSSAVPPSLH